MSTVMMPMAAVVPSQNEIFEHVKTLLVELFEVEPQKVTMEAQLYQDLEIDSIDAIDLILKLKDYTGKKVKPEDFKHVRRSAERRVGKERVSTCRLRGWPYNEKKKKKKH